MQFYFCTYHAPALTGLDRCLTKRYSDTRTHGKHRPWKLMILPELSLSRCQIREQATLRPDTSCKFGDPQATLRFDDALGLRDRA